MKEIRFTPTFVKTKNVRNFQVLMDGLALNAGEGCLGKVTGPAGRGKTRTAQWYAADHGCVYLRVVGPMVTSGTEFLESLCRELHLEGVPRRQGALFHSAANELSRNTRPVFVDELERVRDSVVDLVRDLSDASAAPIVLLGEETLNTVFNKNKRVWSRTFQAMDFEPVGQSDIIFYLKESAGLALDGPVAALMHERSGGDWRLIKSATLSLVQQANANGSPDITTKMVKAAFARTGMGGK